jgi:hypothetical protein
MKKNFTILSMIALSLSSFGQTPITLTSADVPVPSSPLNLLEVFTDLPVQLGPNQNWDYSDVSTGGVLTNTYYEETMPFYTNVGVDVYASSTKNFNANFTYSIFNEYDFNSNGVDDKGLYVPAQAYSLAMMTGSSNDSLIFEDQDYILSTARRIMQFPMTANTSWTSASPRVANFNLKIAAFGLNNTPAQHKYTIHRKDTVVAWGKLSVYTNNGPSIAYDVLMERYEQYAVDSFFVAGAPAPLALLNGMGVSQGQITNVSYGYNFYRSGSVNYLMRLFYGTDNTFTNLVSAFIHTDDLTTLGFDEEHEISYQSLVFPNPSTTNSISVKLIGKKVNNPEIKIFDLIGNLVQTEKLTQSSMDLITIPFNSSLKNGNYILKIEDENNKVIVNESIVLKN